ncbi:MAG: hypothetical protein NZM37_03785 [Sandaracinaceae bacterium]|nr:hypothetical protein [Sandaracinaceae bacterium]
METSFCLAEGLAKLAAGPLELAQQGTAAKTKGAVPSLAAEHLAQTERIVAVAPIALEVCVAPWLAPPVDRPKNVAATSFVRRVCVPAPTRSAAEKEGPAALEMNADRDWYACAADARAVAAKVKCVAHPLRNVRQASSVAEGNAVR